MQPESSDGHILENNKTTTIVSFAKSRNEININQEMSDESDDDDIQISLAPHIQMYLGQEKQTFSCFGISVPLPFERASTRTWWDPRFDSDILEGQYKLSSFPQIRLRFRYSIIYLLCSSLIWSCYSLYLSQISEETENYITSAMFLVFSVICFGILLFTRSVHYRMYQYPISLLLCLLMCSVSLSIESLQSQLSPSFSIAFYMEILMIIYTVVPLPLYLCVSIGILYSCLFDKFDNSGYSYVRIPCHISVHLIAFHILIMTNVRMRGTFMKVGQSLLVRKQLEMEKQLKEKMIHSVMPPKVADWLLAEAGSYDYTSRNPSGGDINSLFRPFNMSSVKDVSILFADIVGFTRMSSKKSASELVAILNELFERFDDLCSHHGCEKISTLGDCYYCVSGCPIPRIDHAQCCVKMGLGMIEAISEFDAEHHEDINMRVGVHTGTVLCGIVGKRRFKFDVWSNDVSLANKMESTGKPGRVHISAVTKSFLNDQYELEAGETYIGMETYFILSPKVEPSSPFSEPSTQFQSFGSIKSETNSLTTALSQPTPTVVTPARNLKVSICNSLDRQNSVSPSRTISPPSSPRPNGSVIPKLLSLKYKLSEMKATSLPTLFAREIVNTQSTSNYGSGVFPTHKRMPSWKYSKLRINRTELENGRIRRIYSPSFSESSTNEKMPKLHIEVPKDNLSICHSINSRKDSGIKSTSRRSSIQQQLFVMNGMAQGELLSQRVSGYYTSSQSSVNNDFEKLSVKLPTPSIGDRLNPSLDPLGECFKKLRKQSDLQLIKCVQDNSNSERSYFVTPPLKSWNLFFKQPELEKDYREKAHRTSPSERNQLKTLACARFNTYFDIFVCLIVSLLVVSVSTAAFFDNYPIFLGVYIIAIIILIVVIYLCVQFHLQPKLLPKLEILLKWYPWHTLGAVLVSLPAVAVLVNINVSMFSKRLLTNFFYLFCVSLVHYCNFTQLNCWMKSSLATIASVTYLIYVTSNILRPYIFNKYLINGTSSTTISPFSGDYNLDNEINYNDHDYILEIPDNVRLKRDIYNSSLATNNVLIDSFDSFIIENIINVVLMVTLVWFLNREFEISYRLSFHGNSVAARDKSKVQTMRDQADILLHNIIPRHVADQLKNTARYSEDVKDAGIIFASIINFSEMYDESYLDGKECLRVLNELVSDFDELLSEPRFSMVEKIKTIGSTFMAASGLNLSQRLPNNYEHLFQLMEFSLALQAAVDNFNTHLLEFSLILRIGYNFGDVTAGVIGTTKLFYDIWGDAVNIASRMDSTGVPHRIQVPVSCTKILEERYNFQHRGRVFVKGKDNMEVALVAGHKN